MSEPKKYGYCDSVEEYLGYFRGEMEAGEPIGFYTMPNSGIETFGLSGTDLIAFVSRCVMTALKEGGIPCIPGFPDYPVDWIYEPKYGTAPMEIHDNVLNEWISNGAGLVDIWTGVWFGLPKSVSDPLHQLPDA